jgi:hypoxanthine phosphoribosyltransferase
VLVADDVADTGQTLALVLSMLTEQEVDSRGAVLYQKPRSTVDVDHVWRSTDRWITFPWSAGPPVTEVRARPA